MVWHHGSKIGSKILRSTFGYVLDIFGYDSQKNMWPCTRGCIRKKIVVPVDKLWIFRAEEKAARKCCVPPSGGAIVIARCMGFWLHKVWLHLVQEWLRTKQIIIRVCEELGLDLRGKQGKVSGHSDRGTICLLYIFSTYPHEPLWANWVLQEEFRFC